MSNTAQQATEIAAPVFKAGTLWAAIAAGIGINTWAEAANFATFCAAALGAIYSILLILEWIWKKVCRPLAVYFGWLKPSKVKDDAN